MSDDWKSTLLNKLDLGTTFLVIFVVILMAIPIIAANWDDVLAYLMKADTNCWQVKELKGKEPIAFNTCTGEAKKLDSK